MEIAEKKGALGRLSRSYVWHLITRENRLSLVVQKSAQHFSFLDETQNSQQNHCTDNSSYQSDN